MANRTRKLTFSVALVVSAALYVPAASAQLQGTVLETASTGRNISVRQRERPEYDSAGILAGGFVISPSLGAKLGYNTNVFQTDADETSDGYVDFDPKITANSNWSRHSLAAEAHGAFRRYFNNSIRNENGFGTSLKGRYDIGVDSAFNLAAQYDRYYETLYDLSSVTGGASPTPVDNLAGTASLTKAFGPLRLSVLGNAERLNYNSYTTLGGVKQSQDDRDRTSAAGALQADYSIGEGTYLFTQIGYENISYDNTLGAGIQNRDSNAVRAIAGVSTDLAALIRGRIGVGYIRRSYKSNEFGNAAGFALEGRVEYFPTELTTVTLNVRRVLEDAATTVRGGYFRTGGDLRIDHEFLRNLLLNSQFRYEVADYGSVLGQARVWRLGAGAKYLWSRHIAFDTQLGYTKRTQDPLVVGNPYKGFTASVGLSYQL